VLTAVESLDALIAKKRDLKQAEIQWGRGGTDPITDIGELKAEERFALFRTRSCKCTRETKVQQLKGIPPPSPAV
jgi:hypothetical protein